MSCPSFYSISVNVQVVALEGRLSVERENVRELRKIDDENRAKILEYEKNRQVLVTHLDEAGRNISRLKSETFFSSLLLWRECVGS